MSWKAKILVVVLATFIFMTKKKRGIKKNTLYLVSRDFQAIDKGLIELKKQSSYNKLSFCFLVWSQNTKN